MKKTILFLIVSISMAQARSQNFIKADEGKFKSSPVLLYENDKKNKLIIFKTPLRVNTDGTPKSYNQYDLRGDSIALNRILNGVKIRRASNNEDLCIPDPQKYKTEEERREIRKEAYTAFEKFRDSNYEVQPEGYKIHFSSVLNTVTTTVNGKKIIKPCVMEGGFLASGTSLKNELPKSKRGECECKNQVNPLEVPALVLAQGANAMKKFGAKVGDLFVAYNPANKIIVYGVINDEGPADNMGEGSVLLNMKLKNVSKMPSNVSETNNLGISQKMLITIIPGSSSYEKATPFNIANINKRVSDWLKENGFNDSKEYIAFLQKI
jgi:hypothetical protein